MSVLISVLIIGEINCLFTSAISDKCIKKCEFCNKTNRYTNCDCDSEFHIHNCTKCNKMVCSGECACGMVCNQCQIIYCPNCANDDKFQSQYYDAKLQSQYYDAKLQSQYYDAKLQSQYYDAEQEPTHNSGIGTCSNCNNKIYNHQYYCSGKMCQDCNNQICNYRYYDSSEICKCCTIINSSNNYCSDNKYYFQCEKCTKKYCVKCVTICKNCKIKYCTKCNDGNQYCDKCRLQCNSCNSCNRQFYENNNFCDKCDICDNLVCNKCCDRCYECNAKYCVCTKMIKCTNNSCKRSSCEMCIEQCFRCGNDICCECVGELNICDECKK